MAPNHCILPGCSTRRSTNVSVYIVSVVAYPRRNKEWQQSLFNFCCKYREKSEVLNLVKKSHAGICEQHFNENDFYTINGKKRVIPGRIPSLELPIKSHDSNVPTPRRPLVRHEMLNYKNVSEIEKDFMRLKRPEWFIQRNFAVFRFIHATLNVTLEINSDLSVACSIADHRIKSFPCSLKHYKVKQILNEAEELSVCSTRVSQKCTVTVDRGCSICVHCRHVEEKREKVKQDKQGKVLSSKAPLSLCSKERLKATVVEQKKQKQLVENQLALITEKLKSESTEICFDFAISIQNLMNKIRVQNHLTPYQQMFWEEQLKLIGCKKNGERYHPDIIRLCLSIYSKSPAAYDEVRSVLHLPSKSTLLDFRYAEKPIIGFGPQTSTRLEKLSKSLLEHERYVFLTFDEMQIQKGLIYDSTSGKLVGFTFYGDTFSESSAMATHILGVYIKGICGSLSQMLGFFPTDTAKSHHLTSIFWEACSILEKFDFKVMCVCADGAANNRKFFSNLTYGSGFKHKLVNPFCPERCIYLWPDPPHLIKVLSSSASRLLKQSGYAATAEYTDMWNTFFDICNSTSGKRGQKNPVMAPFRSTTDGRLHWLRQVFLKYFHDWKDHAGIDKTKFIAAPTYHGICLLIPSVIELIRFLLENTGIEFICLTRISQDCLERHFGLQRSIGRGADNPSVLNFGYNERIISVKKSVKNASRTVADAQPLEKRQRM